MFCPLESVELKTEVCPARTCIYKGLGGRCGHQELTGDSVTVYDIAEIRGEKPYKVKSAAASGKASLTIGVTIARYADYVKESFPQNGIQVVNREQDTHVSRVLQNTFNLHPHQHQYFWDSERFESWRTRLDLTLTLQDVRQALLGAAST